MATIVNFDPTTGQLTAVRHLPWEQVPAAIDANFGVVGQQLDAVTTAVNTNAGELNALSARVDRVEAAIGGIHTATVGFGQAGVGTPLVAQLPAHAQPTPPPAPNPGPAPAAPVAGSTEPVTARTPVATPTVIVPDVQVNVPPQPAPVFVQQQPVVVRHWYSDPAPWIGAGIGFVLAVIVFAMISILSHPHIFMWWWVLIAVLAAVVGLFIGLAVSRHTAAADASNYYEELLPQGAMHQA